MPATDTLSVAERRLADLSSAATRLTRGGVDHSPASVDTPPTTLEVAVIVPAFNDAEFLAHCLESLRRQSFRRWRCYVVDDASPAEVGTIVSRFAARDSRFVLARHTRNRGLPAARNTGILLADEPLIQFLDSDDMLTPWSLEDRIDALRQSWADPHVAGSYGYIAQCTAETKAPDIASWRRRGELTRIDWISSSGECPFNVHAPLLKTSVIKLAKGFDEQMLNGAEDWDLWHRLLRHGYVFVPTRSVTGAYRQRHHSMVRSHLDLHLSRANALLNQSGSWHPLDDELVVADCSMPVGDAASSHLRMLRAARSMAVAAVEAGTADGALSDHIAEVLRPASTPLNRQVEVRSAARAGVLKGLGLTPDVAPQLSAAGFDTVEEVAGAIADELAAHVRARQVTAVAPTPRPGVTVLVAQSPADRVPLMDAAALHKFNDLMYLDAGDAPQSSSDAPLVEVSSNDLLLMRVIPDRVIAQAPVGPEAQHLLDTLTQRHICIDVLPAANPEAGQTTSVVGAAAGRSHRPVRSTTLLAAQEAHIDEASVEQLRALRDRHAGETAIILGNGPSLNDSDLSLLEGQATFGVNSIFLARDRLPEPLSYYVVEDQAVFRDNLDEIRKLHAGTKLLPTDYQSSYAADDAVFFRMNRGFYDRESRTYCLPRFSLDAAQRVYCGQSVTIINLQLAHWMGFRRAVLIGMDFSYTIPADIDRRGDVLISRSNDVNHFHPDYFGAGKTWHDPKLDRVLLSYFHAKRVWESTGRTILNATVGGALELFPRVELADALGR